MLDRPTIERIEAASKDAPILIALSGGGDSVALLHLLIAEFGVARLRAAIVDHALRDGSAADAARAATFAHAVGVEARVLTLSWPDAPNRAQAAAREMRYRALCDEARRVAARVIAVAHSADDQAETVLMRAAGGSTWRGLAGMPPFAPAPVWPEGRGLLIARPLLATRRADLRTLLRDRGAEWIEDPSNANTAYERVRVRANLAAMAAVGLDPLCFARLAAKLRQRVDALDSAVAELVARAARFQDDIVTIDRTEWGGDDETRRRALSALITAAGSAAHEPPSAAVERLEARMEGSLGGAVLSPTRGGVRITRDAGALMGRADGALGLAPLPLPANVQTVWDGRLALTAPAPGWSVVAGSDGPKLCDGKEEVALRDADPAFAPVWLISDRVNHLFRLCAPALKRR